MYFAAGEHELNLKHLEEAAAAAEASGNPVTVTEIAMRQCHVLSRYGGDARQAVRVGRRALESANCLEDEALAWREVRLGHASWRRLRQCDRASVGQSSREHARSDLIETRADSASSTVSA